MHGALQERLIKVFSQFKLSSSFWRHLSLRTCDLSTRKRVDIQQIKIQMQVELFDQLGIIQTDPGDEDLGGTKCLWLSGGKSRQPWKQGKEHRYLDQTLAKQHSIWCWIDILSFLDFLTIIHICHQHHMWGSWKIVDWGGKLYSFGFQPKKEETLASSKQVFKNNLQLHSFQI